MNSYINGAPRLRLFFDNPNDLAVALVMLWGVCLCVLGSAKGERHGDGAMVFPDAMRRVCLFLAATAPVACLFATYSRSGLVSFAITACLLWRFRNARKWVCVSLAVCLFCLAFIPEAGGRFTSIEPLADKSISHRFDAWRGTLNMSLEKPWTGFGASGFGSALTEWHLPVNGSNAIYVTAVSTPLTILGYWGYPAVFAYLWAWGLLLIAGLRGLYHGNRGVAACFIIQTAFLIGGVFAYLHRSWILNAILLASICGIIVFHLKDVFAWKLFYKYWCPASAIASAAVCGLAAITTFLFFSYGYSVRFFSLGAHGESTGRSWTLVPGKPNGCRLAWIAPHDKVREYARALCRPLAMRGWEVLVLAPGAGEILDPETGLAFLHSNHFFPAKKSQRIVGGIGEEGLSALALASRLPREEARTCVTVAVNIESYWPFEEFNPQNTIKAANGPIVLAYDDNDAHYFGAANTLAGLGNRLDGRIDLMPLNTFGENDTLASLRAFFLQMK